MYVMHSNMPLSGGKNLDKTLGKPRVLFQFLLPRVEYTPHTHIKQSYSMQCSRHSRNQFLLQSIRNSLHTSLQLQTNPWSLVEISGKYNINAYKYIMQQIPAGYLGCLRYIHDEKKYVFPILYRIAIARSPCWYAYIRFQQTFNRVNILSNNMVHCASCSHYQRRILAHRKYSAKYRIRISISGWKYKYQPSQQYFYYRIALYFLYNWQCKHYLKCRLLYSMCCTKHSTIPTSIIVNERLCN